MAFDRTATAMLGFGGLALGVVGILTPSVRAVALIMCVATLAITFLYLELRRTTAAVQRNSERQTRVESEVGLVVRELDVHKKIYNLEQRMNLVMRRSRQGEIAPIWGVVVIVFLLLLYVILKAAGIINF